MNLRRSHQSAFVGFENAWLEQTLLHGNGIDIGLSDPPAFVRRGEQVAVRVIAVDDRHDHAFALGRFDCRNEVAISRHQKCTIDVPAKGMCHEIEPDLQVDAFLREDLTPVRGDAAQFQLSEPHLKTRLQFERS